MAKKARSPKEVIRFEDIPNIGPRIAADFKVLGIKDPQDLAKRDPYKLYIELCERTKAYHDPCVLDVFMSAHSFMKGKGVKDWWEFTSERKKNFEKVREAVGRFKKPKGLSSL